MTIVRRLPPMRPSPAAAVLRRPGHVAPPETRVAWRPEGDDVPFYAARRVTRDMAEAWVAARGGRAMPASTAPPVAGLDWYVRAVASEVRAEWDAGGAAAFHEAEQADMLNRFPRRKRMVG